MLCEVREFGFTLGDEAREIGGVGGNSMFAMFSDTVDCCKKQ